MKVLIVLLLMMVPALAAPVADTFSNPVTEARARNLQRQLRCLVCQGESIDESGSPFAADVRHLVRQQIVQGQSDRQIEDFLVARYGDFILMKPPVQPDTWLLWLAPFLVLGAGGAVAWVTVKKAASRGT
ncbi:MAG TPA: cytochrome c-type biogenesis protein [Rhizomicrobium sp.]|jgi:cytochrome c-type biogenesis protein CcmH|nr:cytochrome c-type biogenesis protein [Rhizomicrobium sp.]